MRILILNSDYLSSLRWLYRENPALVGAPYADQMAARNNSLFGVADYYSKNFMVHGHSATEIHINNPWLQSAWAIEHGMKPIETPSPEQLKNDNAVIARLKLMLHGHRAALLPLARALGLAANLDAQARAILLAQIEEFKPDVIFNQDIIAVPASLAGQMRKKGRMLMAYCGVEPPANVDLSAYSLTLSMLGWLVMQLNASGVRAEISYPAFEASIVDRIGPALQQDIAVSFVGSLSASHEKRIALLEAIAARYPLAFWGPGLGAVSANSPLHRCYRGEAFGRSVYDIMRRSRITLNSHVDAARGQAANMRHFEATGMGSFLLTDNAERLADLFEPDVEAVRYNGVDDALKKIAYYLENEDARAAIAKAGQARTSASHTYFHRTAQILEYVNRYGP